MKSIRSLVAIALLTTGCAQATWPFSQKQTRTQRTVSALKENQSSIAIGSAAAAALAGVIAGRHQIADLARQAGTEIVYDIAQQYPTATKAALSAVALSALGAQEATLGLGRKTGKLVHTYPKTAAVVAVATVAAQYVGAQRLVSAWNVVTEQAGKLWNKNAASTPVTPATPTVDAKPATSDSSTQTESDVVAPMISKQEPISVEPVSAGEQPLRQVASAASAVTGVAIEQGKAIFPECLNGAGVFNDNGMLFFCMRDKLSLQISCQATSKHNDKIYHAKLSFKDCQSFCVITCLDDKSIVHTYVAATADKSK